ncbi:MAG: hypothetical protein NTY37_07885 [Methanothrix sp.]|nr:hypothetical protein [Methanothrix sp.]
MSAPKPLKEIELLEDEVEKKSAVDKFYGNMNLGLIREESRNGKAD